MNFSRHSISGAPPSLTILFWEVMGNFFQGGVSIQSAADAGWIQATTIMQ
jgi:hypothetical protein